MHILDNVEDIDAVLGILSFLLFSNRSLGPCWDLLEIEEFLFLQPGGVELYLGDLNSLVNVGLNQEVYILHASLTDFLVDHTRSKKFWINPPARHTAIARRCLQFLQPNNTRDRPHLYLAWMCYYDTIFHCKNAEITPELCDDLINFSFDNLQDVFRGTLGGSHLFTFIPRFLSGLKELVRYCSPHTAFSYLYNL